MSFELPPLPFPVSALEPYVSALTLGFHHGKHHQTYVTNLNNLTEGSPLALATLEDVIRETAKDASRAGIFNNAAQVWNHTFYWRSVKPGGGAAPQGELAERLEDGFGSLDGFRSAFKEAAVTQFGSGWAWLVAENGTLKVTKTGNADTPLAHGQTPLITCDVWEHAYYLDYQNRRPDYVDAFLDDLLNWDFASENLTRV